MEERFRLPGEAFAWDALLGHFMLAHALEAQEICFAGLELASALDSSYSSELLLFSFPPPTLHLLEELVLCEHCILLTRVCSPVHHQLVFCAYMYQLAFALSHSLGCVCWL